jgi:hypothetical protein
MPDPDTASRSLLPSGHPDVLLVRIPVFAKNGTDMKSHAGPRSGISILPATHITHHLLTTALKRLETHKLSTGASIIDIKCIIEVSLIER